MDIIRTFVVPVYALMCLPSLHQRWVSTSNGQPWPAPLARHRLVLGGICCAAALPRMHICAYSRCLGSHSNLFRTELANALLPTKPFTLLARVLRRSAWFSLSHAHICLCLPRDGGDDYSAFWNILSRAQIIIHQRGEMLGFDLPLQSPREAGGVTRKRKGDILSAS